MSPVVDFGQFSQPSASPVMLKSQCCQESRSGRIGSDRACFWGTRHSPGAGSL